jgi:PAS domain S-box-containing protein
VRHGGGESRYLGIRAWWWAAVIWTAVTTVLVVAIIGHSASEADRRIAEWEVLAGLGVVWAAGMAATISGGSTIARRTAQREAIDRSYAELFEALPDATFVIEWDDGDFGPVREVNEAACRLLGRERDELTGAPVDEVFTGTTPQQLSSLASALALGERPVIERRVTSRGEDATVQVELRRFESAGTSAVLVIGKDLGDRQAAERALRRRDNQLVLLSSATRNVNEDLVESVVLRRLVESAMQVLGATTGMAGLFGRDHVEYAEYADAEGFHREGTPLGCLELHDKAGGEPFDEDDALIVLGLAASGAIALENARMLEQQREMRRQLAEREERLRRLAGELSRTEEQERRRIAEGLHDRIGQELAVMRMRLGQMSERTAEEEHRAHAQEVRQLLDRAIADTRALTFEISPPMLYTLGLSSALEWLCEQMEQQHGVAMTLHDDTRGRQVSDDARALLYISARELLMNVVKHANAGSADVRMTSVGDRLWLAVVDDGDGFVPEEAEATSANGFGLFSIRERLRGIDGDMVIRSMPGKGSEIVLEAPLEQETSAREVEDLARDRG